MTMLQMLTSLENSSQLRAHLPPVNCFNSMFEVSGKTVSSGTTCLDCCLMQLSLREQDDDVIAPAADAQVDIVTDC